MKHKKVKLKPPSWLKTWFLGKFDLSAETSDELVSRLRSAQRKNILAPNSLSMMEGVIQVDNLQVRDIMIPRSHIQFVFHDESYHDILARILESGHSRYPVLDKNLDDVEGVLLAKDLLKYVGREDEFDMDDILRPAIVVPESQQLESLLAHFRRSRNHMAVVVDEYSGTSGLVTIEDVLEQIVGEIDDEHDHIDDKLDIRKHGGGRFTVLAGTEVSVFNHYFKTKLPDTVFDTVGGVVTNEFGKIPKQHEELVIDKMTFKVLRSDSRRIQLLEVNTAQAA
ncbi:CBS domain-containing protein [Leucothrix sargassi]|nr:CBS domain-containing protein [Leucothrix sargassi]